MFEKAMSTLGGVTPQTRAKAEEVMRACVDRFGYAPGVLWGMGRSSEHATGNSVDFMVTQHGRGEDAELGNFITNYVLENADRLGVNWVIWRQHLYYSDGSGYDMEDRGSRTDNHYDHPHVYFNSKAYTPPIDESDIEMITESDAKMIARHVIEGHNIVRPDGHSATLGQHIADIAQTGIKLRDGELPVIARPNDDHRAPSGEVLGNMEERIVHIYDRVLEIAERLDALITTLGK